MFNKLSNDTTLIIKNLSYLTFIRFFNIAVKFLLVIYLVRTLGENNYGVLAWSDSVIQYFLIFVNYGFNVYAAKYIVENKYNNPKINEITSSIFIIKSILFIISFIVLFGLSFVTIFDAYKNILFLMLLMGVGEIFFPLWYFQGIEKLKRMAIAVALSKTVLIILTLFIVKSPEDLYLYVFFLVLSQILMGLLGYLALVKYTTFTFVLPSRKVIKSIFYQANLYFIGNLATVIFNVTTIFLIGIFMSMEKVTGFDVSLKILLFFLIPFDILQMAVFPSIARTKNKKLLRKLIYFSFTVGLIIYFIINFFSNELLYVFGGEEMLKYSQTLKYLSLIALIVPVSIILGQCGLIAFGFDKEFNYSLIITAIVYIIIIIILTLINKLTFYNLIYLRIISDLILIIIRGFYIIKNKVIISKF